jgi:hypothetical protein
MAQAVCLTRWVWPGDHSAESAPTTGSATGPGCTQPGEGAGGRLPNTGRPAVASEVLILKCNGLQVESDARVNRYWVSIMAMEMGYSDRCRVLASPLVAMLGGRTVAERLNT